MIGTPIGILIGIITGLVVALMMRTAWNTTAKDFKGLLSIIGEFLAIPTFWFGGPWLSGKLLQSEKPPNFLSNYLVALVVTFVVIAIFPLIKTIMGVGREIGTKEKQGD